MIELVPQRKYFSHKPLRAWLWSSNKPQICLSEFPDLV